MQAYVIIYSYIAEHACRLMCGVQYRHNKVKGGA